MEMQVVESKRGKPVVLYLGYKFHQRKIYQNSDIFWTCVNRKCIGSVTTDKTITTVLKSKEHSICAPDVAKNEVETALFNAKKRSREENLPVTQIYQQEVMNKAADKGLDFVTQIPSFSSVKQQLYHARHTSLGINSLPKHRKDVVVPDKYKHFLLFDNKSDDRILIFAAECGRRLEHGRIFFGDGTFKSCPSLFEQLYTIHMDFGSTEEKTCVWPVIYALLPNRKEVTYTRFFTILKEKIPKFSPVEFHVDFEKAAINGMQKVFPDVKIKGCNFHFNQAIWRKAQELELAIEYREDEIVRKHIRMCAALAHLPPEWTDEGWLRIMASSPENEKVLKFNDYFVEVWLDADRHWICYNNRHRTTNAVEGWHNKLNRTVGKSHPNIYELIKILEDDSNHYRILVEKEDILMSTPKRAKKYCDLDARIKNIVKSFLENRVSLEDALTKLTYVVKYE